MCARLLACPLCSQPSFTTLDALRAGLVSVATRPLMCPVCNEVLVGIDKLTIHLFGHTININDNSIQLSKPININVDNNEINNQNVQVKNALHNWNLLHKETVDTGQSYNKKDKSKNCCDIDHTTQSCCTISNSINKTLMMNSQTKVQNEGSFNESSQVIQLSDQLCQNTSTDECLYNKQNSRLFLESQDDTSEVISELSKTNCLEDCYKNSNTQEENSQLREMNKLEGIWIENLSQVSNQHSTIKKELSLCPGKTQEIMLKQTEINNDQYNLKNNLIISFPHVMTMSENVNVLPSEINNKQNLDDHKKTLTHSIVEVKSDQNVNGEKIISNLKILKEKTERCNICGFHFPDHNILVLHKQLIHMVDEQNSNVTSENLLKSYSCHLCSKVFKMRGSLMIHMRVAHIGHNWGFLSKDGDAPMGINNNGYNCPTCGKNFKKEQHVIQHLKTHEGKQWECDVCSKMFTTKYFLKKHKRLHSGEMPYKCNICDKTFTFQQSYHKHRLYHKDDKPHMCTTCGRSFKELSTLHNHERIHTGEKPFACETCGKCFRQRVSYLVHRRIHTGVMPYTCTMCGKSFRYKVSQRTHKCPVQQFTAQQQSNEIVQTSAVTSIMQENCNEANHSQETNSSQQIKQILNGINDKDNKFVLIINAQGQTVLTRESDLENEQEANFAKTKDTNKNSNEDIWNSDNSKNLNSKNSTNHSDKLLSDNRNNIQDTTDFFSLVMSPLENNLSSPTSEMEHLRLSSPVSKNISQPLFSNFRHPSENINENIIHTDVEETYNAVDSIRCSFETINEESLKQLLYSIDKK
ncbi:zinc finger protein 300-like isoform X1 [Vespa velutina]|uniref:zinc finger protein 300-like isoform X1 n=1 Tax=Vespa velutina TaxID=202808 RepID=UPI001FB560A6|nr:zinc finger protein 300-like isoform X1 [Vespa velutina]